MVIVVERPALIRPVGAYTIQKKSLTLSSKGSSLKLLKLNETFVIRIVCVWAVPTVKSYMIIYSQRFAYLKHNDFGLRYE